MSQTIKNKSFFPAEDGQGDPVATVFVDAKLSNDLNKQKVDLPRKHALLDQYYQKKLLDTRKKLPEALNFIRNKTCLNQSKNSCLEIIAHWGGVIFDAGEVSETKQCKNDTKGGASQLF